MLQFMLVLTGLEKCQIDQLLVITQIVLQYFATKINLFTISQQEKWFEFF